MRWFCRCGHCRPHPLCSSSTGCPVSGSRSPIFVPSCVPLFRCCSGALRFYHAKSSPAFGAPAELWLVFYVLPLLGWSCAIRVLLCALGFVAIVWVLPLLFYLAVRCCCGCIISFVLFVSAFSVRFPWSFSIGCLLSVAIYLLYFVGIRGVCVSLLCV